MKPFNISFQYHKAHTPSLPLSIHNSSVLIK